MHLFGSERDHASLNRSMQAKSEPVGHTELRFHPRAGSVRLWRRSGSPLSSGNHRGWYRLHGRTRSRTIFGSTRRVGYCKRNLRLKHELLLQRRTVLSPKLIRCLRNGPGMDTEFPIKRPQLIGGASFATQSFHISSVTYAIHPN
jgi:hypothetical protein